MPVRRGHVAHQNTYLDTIIRKFDGQKKACLQSIRFWGDRKFLMANAQTQRCGIIFCNEGFCQMFGFSRAELMQQPCTCPLPGGGPGHHEERPGAVGTGAAGLRGTPGGDPVLRQGSASAARAGHIVSPNVPSRYPDIAPICAISVRREHGRGAVRESRVCRFTYLLGPAPVCPAWWMWSPVKNEVGVVIMFILNFQELLESPNRKGGFRKRMTQGWIRAGVRVAGYGLKLPSLRAVALRRPSVSKEQFEGVVVDLLQPNSEDVPLKEFRIPSKESCMQSETEALIEQDRDPHPVDHFPERLEPQAPRPGVLPRSRSRESIRSLRRASSLDGIDGMRADWGSRSNTYLRPSLLNSTSDSDLMKYRTVSRIPQVTLLPPASPAHIEIIAPSKLKDRTHNVTEKVTQRTPLAGGGSYETRCLGGAAARYRPSSSPIGTGPDLGSQF
ncbi:hypothetical protein SKAU_G00290150 [Synaphobranchus kaupii]|uniref:PAS domain-containing protein n=1 Tax=Synaphobranchus kaupii TaxID=118154 RepID=A0A9Q1ETL6_SYNKA|nr:hypothetical protein SKAU_G00290150 [Synaphobranchus kaupii]